MYPEGFFDKQRELVHARFSADATLRRDIRNADVSALENPRAFANWLRHGDSTPRVRYFYVSWSGMVDLVRDDREVRDLEASLRHAKTTGDVLSALVILACASMAALPLYALALSAFGITPSIVVFAVVLIAVGFTIDRLEARS